MRGHHREFVGLGILLLATAAARGDPLPAGAVVRLHHSREAAANAVAFSPDGKILATAGADGIVRLWDPQTGQSLSRTAEAPPLRFLEFAPDGRTLLASERTGHFRLWAVPTGGAKEAPRGHDQLVRTVAFSPDGKTLATCAWYDSIIHLRELPGGADRRLLVGDNAANGRGAAHDLHQARLQRLLDSTFTALRFTPDGGRLLACTLGNDLTVWDVRTGERRWVVPGRRRRASLYHSAAFPPNGRLWAAASVEHHAGMWDALTGGQLLETRLPETTRRSWAVGFSGDGRLVAFGGGDERGVLQLHETASGREVRTREGFSAAVLALASSPDGRLLATAADDGAVIVWDLDVLAPAPKSVASGRDDPGRLWLALADEDGYRKMLALAASPGAVPFLRERLHPATAPAPAELDRFVRELDDNRFEVRERARQELGRVGPPAVAALRRALNGKPSLEVRRRVEQLLEELDRPSPAAEEVRLLRAVDALEQIGTPEARRVLQTLTAGAPDASLTWEARAALDRLARRRPAP
jgi:dipeptidyl aminopeptidase/acylaminoacyl peptidase